MLFDMILLMCAIIIYDLKLNYQFKIYVYVILYFTGSRHRKHFTCVSRRAQALFFEKFSIVVLNQTYDFAV